MDQVKEVFGKAVEVMPGKEIHVLVNCAGIQRRAPAVEFLEEDWDDVSGLFSVCLFSSFGSGLVAFCFCFLFLHCD